MTGRLGQCSWCMWDCPSPDVAPCVEADAGTEPPLKKRKWTEDVLPDISHYREPNADQTAS